MRVRVQCDSGPSSPPRLQVNWPRNGGRNKRAPIEYPTFIKPQGCFEVIMAIQRRRYSTNCMCESLRSTTPCQQLPRCSWTQAVDFLASFSELSGLLLAAADYARPKARPIFIPMHTRASFRPIYRTYRAGVFICLAIYTQIQNGQYNITVPIWQPGQSRAFKPPAQHTAETVSSAHIKI